jgi:arylsulfatase A-like enzyme
MSSVSPPPKTAFSLPAPVTVLRQSLVAASLLLLAACNGDAPTTDSAAADATNATQSRPNILLIVADDLGFSDLGIFGGEIPTPNLDMLAASGMLLTDFHSGLACSPTRAMLMSGTDSHLAGLGVMGGPRRAEHQNQPGYAGYLNFRVASLADLLSDAGYNTYMTGKWHLGMDLETSPLARGFKKSFVSLDGAAHLGPWDWRGPQNANYRDGETLVNVDENFYSTRFYTERMLQYLEEDKDDDKPFFAWLAYTAPHWPLQAPAESIARFRGQYDAGYEALYTSRFERQKSLGLVPADAEPIPLDRFQPRWDELSAEEKQVESRKMEIYAAMVSDLDRYIGDVITYLRDNGKLDNTLIMFMSDNGTETSRMDLGPSIADHVGIEYDHSLDNLGSGTSYVMYGRNWASATETPLNRHKATAFEGGINVPTFVWYPALIEGGTRSGGFGTVMDVLPTFLALAGTSHPGTRYRALDVEPVKGKSLLPLLRGEADEIHGMEEVFGWELNRHRSVRQGNWKLVWDQALPELERRWQLFNLQDDPFEQQDLSAEYPERYQDMIRNWDTYAAENGVIY